MCNFVYSQLAEGRNRVQLAELDTILAPPEEREAAQGRMNQAAMGQLGGFGLVPPPPGKKRQPQKKKT